MTSCLLSTSSSFSGYVFMKSYKRYARQLVENQSSIQPTQVCRVFRWLAPVGLHCLCLEARKYNYKTCI